MNIVLFNTKFYNYLFKQVETNVENVDGQKLPSLIGLDAGKLFCSSEPSMLTEAETEYVVCCIKHIFNNYLILQVCIFVKINIYTDILFLFLKIIV